MFLCTNRGQEASEGPEEQGMMAKVEDASHTASQRPGSGLTAQLSFPTWDPTPTAKRKDVSFILLSKRENAFAGTLPSWAILFMFHLIPSGAAELPLARCVCVLPVFIIRSCPLSSSLLLSPPASSVG